MSRFFKSFGFSVAGLAVIALATDSWALSAGVRSGGRAGDTGTGRAVTVSSGSSRMPTMSTVSMNTYGNIAPSLPTGGGSTMTVTPDKDNKNNGTCIADYTIEKCMSDIANCVNGGALPNGMNDLFNDDMWATVSQGSGWCVTQIDKCIAGVCDKDNKPVFTSSLDVWLNFYSRRVQPEYYNFVLRKTGLTPKQAERVCWMLDDTTYGNSFTSVATNDGKTVLQGEATRGQGQDTDVHTVYPYNRVAGDVSKDNNSQRGHYARWDATKGECLLRVAAYNKDKQISNTVFFNTIGDKDEMAEAWQAAGTTFTCNKDLFGFSLFKDTQSVAMVGAGATVVGTAVGAGAGAGVKKKHEKMNVCSTAETRRELGEKILKHEGELSFYISGFKLENGNEIKEADCKTLLNIALEYKRYMAALEMCKANPAVEFEVQACIKNSATTYNCVEQNKASEAIKDAFTNNANNVDRLKDALTKACTDLELYGSLCVKYMESNGVKARLADGESDCKLESFQYLQKSVMCDAVEGGCTNTQNIKRQIQNLSWISEIDELTHQEIGKNEIGKGAAIGAGVGLGAGGLATAITAFVEKGNITCRVGDGLDKVGFGKSYTIDTLKDFWIKWKLQDATPSSQTVSDCSSWKKLCESFSATDCEYAQVKYKPADSTAFDIYSACRVQDNACAINLPVATAYSICEN